MAPFFHMSFAVGEITPLAILKRRLALLIYAFLATPGIAFGTLNKLLLPLAMIAESLQAYVAMCFNRICAVTITVIKGVAVRVSPPGLRVWPPLLFASAVPGRKEMRKDQCTQSYWWGWDYMNHQVSSFMT